MILTVLSDNRTSDERLVTEHGLSLLLDTGERKVLLDTGASDVFIRNASVLGLELGDVDYVFLSHGHKDHTGGLEHLLTQAPGAKVIVSPNSLDRRFSSSRKGMHDISPDWPLEKMEGRVLAAEQNMTVDGMHVIADICMRHALPKADGCLFVSTGVPDDFCHEIALYVDGLLFTGCAHKGILNILDSCHLPVRIVVGGFHLLDSSSADENFETGQELVQIASELVLRYPEVTFYTGHCTGDKAYETLKTVMGNRLHSFSCGMCLEI